MNKCYQFELEISKIINFIENNTQDSNLLNNIYKTIACKTKKGNVSSERAFLELISSDDQMVKTTFQILEMMPINFSYKKLEDKIKEVASFSKSDLVVPKINNFNDLKLFTNSVLFKKSEKNIKKIYISIIMILEKCERKANKIINMPQEEIDVLTSYCESFKNNNIINNNLLKSTCEVIEKESLFDDLSKDDCFTELKKYTKKHNQIIISDRGHADFVKKEKQFGLMEWYDDYNMEDFVDAYFEIIKTCDSDIIRYILPQNKFSRYDEFLKILIKKVDEISNNDISFEKKYEELEKINNDMNFK